MNHWNLEVKNFAAIKQANIAIKPLTLFVGDNNSGKSYLASLVWGIDNIPETINLKYNMYSADIFLKNQKQNSEVYNLISEATKRLKSAYSILQDNINPQTTDQYLVEEKDNFLISLFNKKINCDFIKIDNYTEISKNALYLPASRTGFILTYKFLVSELMDFFQEKNKTIQNRFSAPIIDFLQRFTKIDAQNKGEYFDIGESLEQQILKGNIHPEQSILNEFSYCPLNSTESLPFYLSSSLVTELAPLIIFLKYSSDYNAIILEEPEAHLHPAVQRILIRHLIKLVNRGVPVLLTTHSDVIIEQINNLMSLSRHPEREKLQAELGYSDEELIHPEKVAAYQFNNTPEGTDVISLQQIDNNGFDVPTFNESILALAKESRLLQWD